MKGESTRQRLTRIAEPIIQELGITELWAVVGDQKNSEWHLKIWREPVVQVVIDDEKADAQIAADIRARLKKK